MAQQGKDIFVYDDFSSEKTLLMGYLYVDVIKGTESYSFEFDDGWLKENGSLMDLDPLLVPFSGRQYPPDKKIFGLFADSSPDCWGRVLMNKRERLIAEKEGRKPAKLHDSDYLIGVFDETRMGGIRLKTEEKGPFVSAESEASVPPWTTLRSLEEASRNFEKEEGTLTDKWLKQLIAPGSSLGGARPKATVTDTDGQLWIAKFPSRFDENDTGAWEMVVHDLAVICGLNVPEAKLEKFSKLGGTYVVKRFDRNKKKRIHMASAMTLLGKMEGCSSLDESSYLDIAAVLRASGAEPKKDLRELWKRIVFNMAVSNTDDHLRNHAFLFKTDGWVLSPMYDVNPVPYGDELSLNVDEKNNGINIDLAVQTAPKFGIDVNEAESISREILTIVKENWERLASFYEISRGRKEAMRPAFSLCCQH